MAKTILRPKNRVPMTCRLTSTVKVIGKAVDGKTGEEVPALNPDEPLKIEGIANANIADRVNERLDPRGAVLENYLQNPIILTEHDYCKPIGSCIAVEIQDDGVHFAAEIGRPQLAPLTQLQKDTRSLVAQEVLKAISIGFIPIEIQPAEYDETGKVVKPLIYTKWELLEISLVAVPCNAGSLFSMKELKSMTPEELAALGLKRKSDGMGGEGEAAQGPAAEMLQKIYDGVNAVISKVADMENKIDELLKEEEGEEEDEGGEEGEGEKGVKPDPKKKPEPKKPDEEDGEQDDEEKPKKPAKPDPAKDDYKKTAKRIDGLEARLGEMTKAMTAIAEFVAAKK